jgi:hypothetical protein
MNNKETQINSLEDVIDDALKKATRVLAIVSVPALAFTFYRNMLIDFLPFHQVMITSIWIIFVYLGYGKLPSNQVRYYGLLCTFAALFLLAGFRNNSFLTVDFYLIIFAALMSFRFSILQIGAISGVLITILLLVISEKNYDENTPYIIAVSLHISSLFLAAIVFYATRKLVTKYNVIYASQIEENIKLQEKNKKSYSLVVEAEESSEAEKSKIRSAAFSLSSQINQVQKVLNTMNERERRIGFVFKSVKDRINDVSGDLLQVKEDGRFLSSETENLNVAELCYKIDNYLDLYRLSSADGEIDIALVKKSSEKQEYKFPLNSVKTLIHHLIYHWFENYKPSSINLEIDLGVPSRNMRQVRLKLSSNGTETVSEAQTVQLNKKLDSKQNFETGWPHLNISKAILRNISGSCEIASSGTEIKADVKFWVEK